MIEKDLHAADVRVGGALLWDLVPYLIPYEAWWKDVESQSHLESLPFFTDMLRLLKLRFRRAETVDEEIAKKKKEREEEAQSKVSQTQSEETATKVPKTRKINRKKNDQPPAKRQKVEVPDDRILSEQELPQVPPQQQLGPTRLVVQNDPSPYSIYQHGIIARELEIDYLWHQLRENKREQKRLLKEFNELKAESKAHRSDPLADSD